MAEYEVVIVQERYEIDPDMIDHLSSLGRRFSIVRPDLYDVINRVAIDGYCAIARNQAIRLGMGEWVVFLCEGSDPDTTWFADLERDLDGAQRLGAAVCVSADSPPEATRACDIAYRRDVVDALGGFDESRESEGSEDFLAELELTADDFKVIKGSRRCARNSAG